MPSALQGRNWQAANESDSITTFGVNAGKKRAGIPQAQQKSPDTMTSMTARNLAGAGTIGELAARDNTKSDAMEYEAESSGNPL